MRKSTAILLASAITTLLSGCTDRLFARVRPDEFAVQRQAPLYIPPDFALTPPTPGAPRPAQRSAQQDALAAMFGGEAGRSPVETAALRKAGTADAGIRSTVGDPKTNTVDKNDITRDIVAAPEGNGREAQVSTGK
ncbi:MAG: DUF3035 domain-containing protein [Sphingomonadales bacterium]|nr:DUF3035 domain-containing protein [Sphingomonadales bacterium]MDE2170056.1 DUF3035 domain-containing protein [Sphingomonadales bacterium]